MVVFIHGVRWEMRTTTHESLLSSGEARAAILSSHEELRGMVTETMHFADGATRSGRDFEPLRIHVRNLCAAFEEHMDFEERILPAALRDVIGWGSALRAQIERGHEQRRLRLASAMLALEPEVAPSSDLVEHIRALVDSVLADLTNEELCLLTADLDALAVDTQGG
jgi:hypothetical protein